MMTELERVKSIIEEIKPGADLSDGADLIKDKVLDSFSIVRLVASLEDEFDVEITPVDITEDNFRSAESIGAMIERLLDD